MKQYKLIIILIFIPIFLSSCFSVNPLYRVAGAVYQKQYENERMKQDYSTVIEINTENYVYLLVV